MIQAIDLHSSLVPFTIEVSSISTYRFRLSHLPCMPGRKSRLPHFICALAACSIVIVGMNSSRAAEPPKIDFDRQIRPLLSDTCFICHGPDEKKRDSDLRLDLKDSAFADLGGHKAIVPGDVAASELIKRITSSNPDERMPPPDAVRQLKPAQIQLLTDWVAQGAPWEQHWSFTPIARPALPDVKQSNWPTNALDRFVLARLEQESLAPSPPANKEALLRRVTLDLTGLPPTLAEIDAFLADDSPGAYERVVDRLFASPRYGERMVWEWLDVARYADTNGYQGDRTRTMWPWRDWAIAAINRNQPYDQFTIEQLAGDLLDSPTFEQRIATGFQRNHMLNGEGGRIAEESRVDYVIDRVDTTAATWLGLTLGCARCHDHKYDPFTQREYFQLYAYYNNITESGSVDRDGSANPVVEAPTREQQARFKQLERDRAAVEQQLAALPTEVTAERASEKDELTKRLDAATKARDDYKKQFPIVMIMEERPQPRESYVLERGQYNKYGVKVTPQVPAQLIPLPAEAPATRLSLAKWLVDPSHPLTARVTVNRQWQQFFGFGLVKTTEDFGVQGERPSHPQLLDYLAAEFIASGWDVKRLQRLIVTSSTYRQSSRVSEELVERDPENRLLARGPRYRLSSAIIRDQALAASGLFVEQLGGPAVKPYQPGGVWEEMSFGNIRYDQDHGPSLYRRSLYTFWRRTTPPTMLFDVASRQVCSVRHARTNTPLQSLTMLNDVTFIEAARALAQRVLTGDKEPADRITTMFRLLTSRRPSAAELQVLSASLARFQAQYTADLEAANQLVQIGESKHNPQHPPAELAAYTSLATLLLNLDETLSKE